MRSLLAGCVTAMLIGGVTPAAEEPINKEWLDKDLAVIRELQSHWPPPTASVADYLQQLNRQKSETTRDLGFGVSKQTVHYAGGYSTSTVTILGFQGKIATVRLDCTHPMNSAPVVSAIRQAWGATADWIPGGVRRELVVAATMSELLAAPGNALGSYASPGPTAKYAYAHARLLDPFADLAYGDLCGYGAAPPEGRREIGALTVGRQTALIRDVLRSTNPEARIYAAEALTTLARTGVTVPDEEMTIVKKLLTFDTPITTCSGCIYMQTPSSEIKLQDAR